MLRLFQWASTQPNYSAHPSIFHELLGQLDRVGSIDSMLSLLNQMHSSACPVDESTFLIFLETYANFELHAEINTVIHLMEHDFALKPHTRFYNVALNLLVKANKLKLVETLHSKMMADGVTPDVSTFIILIRALCKAH
ncbi:Pentatricopeptide repeat-containing protein [Vigna angularis]|uniref:Pentatricopeptide repeat-containing protein n=1 Tax=Phaseolus angularis TaxID=3914 RepID=A0A8T0KQX3_PHAAN|nr:Pentatricopeptide repeat-containing protein [Vigna angularis]